MYANDSVLKAPSTHELQLLIHVCESYAKDDCIIFISSKSNIRFTKPRNLKDLKVPNIFVYDKPDTMKKPVNTLVFYLHMI